MKTRLKPLSRPFQFGRPEPLAAFDKVLELVAAESGVSREQLLSKRRTDYVAHARFVAFYLCHKVMGMSLHQINERFGRADHTGVLYGVQRVEELAALEKPFATRIMLLARQLPALADYGKTLQHGAEPERAGSRRTEGAA